MSHFGGRNSNQNFEESFVQMGIPPNPKLTSSKLNLSPKVDK